MKTYDELIEMFIRELELINLKIAGSTVATQNLRLQAKNLKRNISLLRRNKKNGQTK